jgi:aromatic ring-opening dioxygenase LigB subunit
LVPFHVNCYGSNVIRAQGVAGHLAPGEVAEADPPGPTPARCFDLGAVVARAIKASPWRVALVASSSWSHAFLTEKTNYILPDMEADRRNFEQLKAGRLSEWRKLTTADIESSGQHEFLNWVVLAGAMHELGMKPQIVDWIETYIFNSNKCFAIFNS